MRAVLQYGAFPKGEGDAFSDVEFYVYVDDDAFEAFDPAAWIDAIESPLAFFENEYGTQVAIFADLVRGEFHFEPQSRAAAIASWRPVERRGDPAEMVLLDRDGALESALALVARVELAAADVQAVHDRFVNGWLLGAHVLRRGERARASSVLESARTFLLQLARVAEGNVEHWLTPTRRLAHELSPEARRRFAACHADLRTESLEAAFRSALAWGQELAAKTGVDARPELAAALRDRCDAWFPAPSAEPDARASETGGWRRRDSRKLFESSWFSLRQDDVTLPGGEEITYTLVEHPGYAMVVPVDGEGRVLLERVYRYTVQQTLLECPSGGLDGDAPEVAAHRELREETGWIAEHLEPLGSYYGSNGISDERFHLFLATGLRDTGRTDREPTEQIELEWMPLAHAARLARAGGVQDAPSALALMLAEGRSWEAAR